MMPAYQPDEPAHGPGCSAGEQQEGGKGGDDSGSEAIGAGCGEIGAAGGRQQQRAQRCRRQLQRAASGAQAEQQLYGKHRGGRGDGEGIGLAYSLT